MAALDAGDQFRGGAIQELAGALLRGGELARGSHLGISVADLGRSLALGHACGTRDPLGVVARAIRGRSRVFRWRGGATAAKPAGVRVQATKGALRPTRTCAEGKAGCVGAYRGSERAGAAVQNLRRREPVAALGAELGDGSMQGLLGLLGSTG